MEKQSEIKQLMFPESVRLNPYQQLGDLKDSSLLFREILDNSRDELIASESCHRIWMRTDGDLHIVADDGRGINVSISATDAKHRSQMELAVAEIYAGGKYEHTVISSGLHGIGSSAVNAVSEVFKIACKITPSNKDQSIDLVKNWFQSHGLKSDDPSHTGYYLFQEYHKGIKAREEILDDEQLKQEFHEDLPELMSTIVGFTADLSIVRSNRVNYQDEWTEYTGFVLKRFYNKDGIEITLNGEVQDLTMNPYKYEFLKTVKLTYPDYAEINKEVQVYLTFEFDEDLSVMEKYGCVNMVSVHRGLHINFAEDAITQALREKFSIVHNHLSEGLRLNVIVLAKKVGYDSQTKVRLVSIDGWYREDMEQLIPEVRAILDEHEEEVQAHVDKLNELAASYESISAKRYIESMINISSSDNSRNKSFQPVKLIDASAPEYSREGCEMFICEGNSASGTIVKARDPYYHAVMPLKGVSLNVSWQEIDQAFENDEVRDIISAIGTGVDELYDMNALRYDKIIIAVDADADGYHIAALVLGIFASFMQFLINEGKIYILESPFYKQNGKFYYRGEEDQLDKSKPFDRFKGLGSLQAYNDEGRKEIIDIFVNPETRRLTQVTPEKMELAIMTLGDKYTRNILMKSRQLVKSRVTENE